jgi:hypothetical protein
MCFWTAAAAQAKGHRDSAADPDRYSASSLQPQMDHAVCSDACRRDELRSAATDWEHPGRELSYAGSPAGA